MKRDKWLLIIALALIIGVSSCTHDEIPDINNEDVTEATTHIGLNIRIVDENLRSAAPEDDINNYIGLYRGSVFFETLDVYIVSEDGQNLLMTRRFTQSELMPAQQNLRVEIPFKAKAGPVQIIVVMNSPNPLHNIVPPRDWRYDRIRSNANDIPTLLSGNPAQVWAQTTDASIGNPAIPGSPYYGDFLVLSGRNENFTVKEGITIAMVQEGENVARVDLRRLPARAFATRQNNGDYEDGQIEPVMDKLGNNIGYLTNITWTVGQTANAVYLFRRGVNEFPQYAGNFPPNADPSTIPTYSWGYDFVPGVSGDYAQAATYYDYNGLQNTTRKIPLLINVSDEVTGSINYWQMPGIFVTETTHESGIDATASKYKKGNTTYILVRAKYAPNDFVGYRWGEMEQAKPTGLEYGTDALIDGTFYVGVTDGLVYASAEDARSAQYGIPNQLVKKYDQGKVLYYMWLNPDENINDPNFDKPINSPVVRNNIYHAHILGFSGIGYNWNPLVPPGTNNPDPKPVNPFEPAEPPVDPTDPLSNWDTYMSAEITVLNWGFHSYEIDL
jgi:hypothetical protein